MKIAIVALFLTIFWAAAMAEADTFRCPNGNLVSTGDSISEVVVKCDPPTFTVKRIESEEAHRGKFQIIEVEEWTYNQGPNTLLHFLIFRNGVLVQVKTGSFGR